MPGNDSIILKDSLTSAWAITILVVVPSPASSAVLVDACLMIVAPRCSTGSDRFTALATVTPSLVMCGLPYSSSRITVFPAAPKVVFTASAILLMPVASFSRASLL